MKIEQYWERNGIRLRITLESADLPTHSRMQCLREPLINTIKTDLAEVLQDAITDIENCMSDATTDFMAR